MIYYTFAKEFGYLPQEIDDLSIEHYAMLRYGIEEFNKAQEEAQNGKKSHGNGKSRPAGPAKKQSGSSIDGKSIASVADLMKAMGQ